MDRRIFILVGGAATFSLAGRVKGKETAVKNLGELLESIRKEHGLPGIAAASVRGDRLVAEGVAGVRRVGGDDKIALDDRFALASCTKRMTAAMIARLIDAGKLSFDTTLADALPEIPMREDYRSVTVAQLLSFTGGIQPYLMITPMATPIVFQLKGSPAEQREQFVRHLLQEEPAIKPGTERKYSNASYGLVAFIAERRTGTSWEALMDAEVFKPLAMKTAGFGRPRSTERPNEPLMHRQTADGYEPEMEGRQPVMAALAAAGNVHCSIRDFAKFASYELNSVQGKNSLLTPPTAKRFQSLTEDRPAEGRSFFGGSPFVSSGCILWPSKNLAAVVAVNGGGAHDAIRAVMDAIKQRDADW